MIMDTYIPKDGSFFLSVLDENRFKVKTAKAQQVSIDNLDRVLELSRENGVEFLIARCHTDDLRVAQKMEEQGFLLMDTLVCYTRDLEKPLPLETPSANIRPFQMKEIEEILLIGKKAFKGYCGHYHADPRLEPEKCDEVYVSWIKRSCLSKEVADEVLIAEDSEQILGFATIKINDESEIQGALYAVTPEAQGKGLCRSFMVASMLWGRLKGLKRLLYRTQITNIAAQKVLGRLGAELSYSAYTFHKWFI